MTAPELLSIACLFVLAACGELPATDDPRMTEEFVERGICRGGFVICDDRTVAQCENGCTIAVGCYSTVRDSCAAHTSEECWADGACRKTWGTCIPADDICESRDTSTSCLLVAECTWGEICQGKITGSCVELEDRSTCVTSLGCTWVIE